MLVYVAIPHGWTGRGVVPRDVSAQKLADRWPILTMTSEKWQPTKMLDSTDEMMDTSRAANDEAFKTAVVSKAEMQMDAAGELQQNDLGNDLDHSASNFTWRSGVNGQIQKSREHFRGGENVAKDMERISEST